MGVVGVVFVLVGGRWVCWQLVSVSARSGSAVRSPVVGRLVGFIAGAPARGVLVVGFSGSRHLAQSHFSLVSRVVAGFSGHSLAVGCARGADQAVRLAAPGAQVFYASAFGSGRASFVRRSAALVQAVAASSSPCLVGFVAGPCPASVVPSPSVSACFCGSGSGSWATLALAAGLGVAVVVFWCGPGPVLLPGWGGSWRPGLVGLAGGHRFMPGAVQQSLF